MAIFQSVLHLLRGDLGSKLIESMVFHHTVSELIHTGVGALVPTCTESMSEYSLRCSIPVFEFFTHLEEGRRVFSEFLLFLFSVCKVSPIPRQVTAEVGSDPCWVANVVHHLRHLGVHRCDTLDTR